MQIDRSYYLIKLQYLGFRYHGWQKQPDLKTVERMVERTVAYVLDHRNFKVLASGRTDAQVSVNQTYIELFVDDEPLDVEEFFPLFNKNLPQDIRALSVSETHAEFNIIHHAKLKEYLYFFSFGEKFHPFCAPFMTNVQEELELKAMEEAARFFEGPHDFKAYTFRPNKNTQTQGEILRCEIIENTLYSANFFPEKSYALRIKSKGFKRRQIRLIMGALFDLGKGKITKEFIRKSLEPKNDIKINTVAPASGLILNSVILDGQEKRNK